MLSWREEARGARSQPTARSALEPSLEQQGRVPPVEVGGHHRQGGGQAVEDEAVGPPQGAEHPLDGRRVVHPAQVRTGFRGHLG